MKTVGILIYNEVEVLDACGPFEVFATTRDGDGALAFRVLMIAEASGPVLAVGGLKLLPNCTLAECPPLDVLVIPGGAGRRLQSDHPPVVEWIGDRLAKTPLILTVCTGLFIVGRAMPLSGLEVTTHFSAFDELEATHPEALVRRTARHTDNGHLVTAAGIAAGIDASLHVVARLLGAERAAATARRMEYSPVGPASGSG